MLTNFQNTFLTEIKATNDKLDDLTERVSRIEMKLYGEDNQTLTPGVDRTLLRGRGPVNMLSGRTRPKIKRFPAVDLSDDIDTSSSDGSFRMKLDVNGKSALHDFLIFHIIFSIKKYIYHFRNCRCRSSRCMCQPLQRRSNSRT